MARDRGQLVKKGDQKYLLRVYLGRIEGKRRYTSKLFRGTRKDADAALTKWLREMDTDTFIVPQDHKRVSELAWEWLDTKTKKAQATQTHYRMRLLHQIVPFLGGYRVGQLTEACLQDWINLLGRKYSPATITHTRVVLNQMLKLAIRRGYLARNPLMGVEMPKRPVSQVTADDVLTAEQVQKLLQSTQGTRYHALWALLLGTGLRPQEACALQWGDIGEDGSLQLSRVFTTWNCRSTVNVSPVGKTQGSLVPIQLPADTRRILIEHRAWQLRDMLERGYRNPEAWLFTDHRGNHTLIGSLREVWYRSLRDAGLPRIALYNTRHTHATLLLAKGVHLKAIQGRLRHASITTTMDRYARFTPQMDQEAADAFDSIMSG